MRFLEQVILYNTNVWGHSPCARFLKNEVQFARQFYCFYCADL